MLKGKEEKQYAGEFEIAEFHQCLVFGISFEYSRNRKCNSLHLTLLLSQDSIYRLKVAFNKEFGDTFKAKEQEMNRINDRNTRISKILNDLNFTEQLLTVEWSLEEKPEEVLTVKDSEVTLSLSFPIFEGIQCPEFESQWNPFWFSRNFLSFFTKSSFGFEGMFVHVFGKMNPNIGYKRFMFLLSNIIYCINVSIVYYATFT